ncbi:hypothetical protein [Bacillus alkalicellulosilyticus]|uniref:hypothetical protein n=1 Tax=Alkalihalobacterium alkalicellulosilyticum TaxID=1912214 RepID=UPI0009983344|nr:hypothetical protein [Bacillus alkalicellulosilyticus]
MKNYVLLVAIIFLFIFTIGCSESINSDGLSADGKHAFNYLKEKGYKVVEFHEESSVVITKDSCLNGQHNRFLQTII